MNKQLMTDFENYIDTVENVIFIGYKISDLKGVGTEYLVKNGDVIAKFYDGNLIRGALPVDKEETTAIIS